jgi:PPOX class probable F420-dependent enzyme
MSTAMTREEREAFLAGTHVGLVAVADPEGGPLVVPVWYEYTPREGIRFATGGTSRKTTLLRAAGRAGFCVQTEAPPYRYVSVEGAVSIAPVDYARDIRDMALRYLGEERGSAYLTNFASEIDASEQVLVTITPERWRTVDYSKIGL